MADEMIREPIKYDGVMVSSTFKDLEKHRSELMKALRKEDLFAIGMEEYVPTPDDDVISSSLNMVRKASAYIGLISHRCGQVPESVERNPESYSITRMEFEEAQALSIPTLIFVMGEDHQVKAGDVETNPEKQVKLKAYRERAKEGRIYLEFESVEDFVRQAIHGVASLRRYLDENSKPETSTSLATVITLPEVKPELIPAAPAFYAEPPYIGSHEFVGRRAQLETLNDWASPSDSHPVMLFEAIGGAGKSMLTWEWVTKHTDDLRDDWAGRFWYSFYEKGAIMADFCRRALAYMTGRPLEVFSTKKTAELGEILLAQLKSRPWLLVLDGLERVLVSYHRFDAAQLSDEEAGTSDEISSRDPCAGIRPEDDDLLRALSAASPSKLLLTSRLIPRVLVNQASQAIPGVRLERLPGLRPTDAEAMIRACGISGRSEDIQDYLRRNCDCHPLVTGALAGIINDYLPDRGNFDTWAADRSGGGQLNLANLDLVQRRNHILRAAIDAVPEKGRHLISTMAIISQSVDYATLSAINPHLPPEPERISEVENPEDFPWWDEMESDEREGAKEAYESYTESRRQYDGAMEIRSKTPEFLLAPRELENSVRDLEHRGLLQYDASTKRYDLHPVVRGFAAGGLETEEKDRFGQRVVDHFSLQSHSPYEQAATLVDVQNGVNVVRVLLQMARWEQALSAYRGDLSQALAFNLDAYAEILSLLHPFFPNGWPELPRDLETFGGAYLRNDVGIALHETGNWEEAIAAYGANIRFDAQNGNWESLCTSLANVSGVFDTQDRIAKSAKYVQIGLDIASLLDDQGRIFVARLQQFSQLSASDQLRDAEEMWSLLDPMGRDWARALYRQGQAELSYAWFRFYLDDLQEEDIARAEELVKEGRGRGNLRSVHRLRGMWRLDRKEYRLAVESLSEVVRMDREIGAKGGRCDEAETLLASGRFHLEQINNPSHEFEELSRLQSPSHVDLAELWLAIGDRNRAQEHALAGYKKAWADGEPYVRSYDLNRACLLLDRLDIEIPKLPSYNTATDGNYSWEDDVAAAVKILRAEKETEEYAEQDGQE